MKQFYWRKTVFLPIGLALTTQTWAANNVNDVMHSQSLPNNMLAEATTALPTGQPDEALENSKQPVDPKASYQELKTANLANLATLNQKMGWVLSHNYYDFLAIASLVEKALNELNAAKKAENQATAAAEAGEWQNAVAAAMTWQNTLEKVDALDTQIKAAVEEQGAKQVIGAVVSETPTEEKEEKVADGATLYSDKGCIACHGLAGKQPIKPSYPKLAGQDVAYAVAQMKDIKSSARANGESVAMKGVMHLVSVQEMEVIADWLGSLEMDLASEVSSDSEGAMLYNQKGCMACHGADAKTPLPNYPKLAGQNQEYAVVQMADIKSGVRNNGLTAAMKGIMFNVSDDEIQTIAGWLESLGAKASVSEPAADKTPEPETTQPAPASPAALKSETPSDVAQPAQPDLASPAVPKSETPSDAEMTKVLEGAELYTNKGCAACHGPDGQMPIMSTYPKLAGQNREYAVAQMGDIKSGARNNGLSVVMKGILHMVSDEEMSTIASWLASLPITGGMATDATLAAQGAELYQSKMCHTCHGSDAQTPIMPTYPKLSGQNLGYAIAQMKDIKSGARDNGFAAVMKGIMIQVNEEEMQAIAQWLASP